MTEGLVYFVCVQVVDTIGGYSDPTCTDGAVADGPTPDVPALVAPGDGQAGSHLVATYEDPDPATPGRIEFEVCSDDDCTGVAASGFSSRVASGSDGAWIVTGLSPGSWWWRARAHDSVGNASAWSDARDLLLTSDPIVTEVAPSATWIADSTPTFEVSYVHPDDQAGHVVVELCASNPGGDWGETCPAGFGQVASLPLDDGDTAAVEPSEELSDGTWWWRAKGVDLLGAHGPYTTPRQLRIDTTAPDAMQRLDLRIAASDRLAGSWSATVDRGVAGITYDAEEGDGTTWSALCTDIAERSCGIDGVAPGESHHLRVRACDTLDNCTPWQVRVASGGWPHALRTTMSSTMVSSPIVQVATMMDSGTDEPGTSVDYGSGPSWLPLQPAITDSTYTVGSSEPDWSTPPSFEHGDSGGWIIEGAAGTRIDRDDLVLDVVADSSDAAGVGRLHCRAWLVTTGGYISDSEYLGGGTVASDVLTGDAGDRWQCVMPPAFRIEGGMGVMELGADQALFFQVWLEVDADSSGSGELALHVEGDLSNVVTPPYSAVGSGAEPEVPTPVVPGLGEVVGDSPYLAAEYQHDDDRDGALEFELARYPRTANVVERQASAMLEAGDVGAVQPAGLVPGSIYTWRVRAVDDVGLRSDWSALQYFQVAARPDRPTSISPAPGSDVVDGAIELEASAFSGDGTHEASEWQVTRAGGSFADAVSAEVTGAQATWTVPDSLEVGARYEWRVRYRSDFGLWSGWSVPAEFRVEAATTLEVGIDDPDVSMTAGPASDGIDSSVIDVTADGTGYLLSVAWDGGAPSDGVNTPFDDWTGTSATPTEWAAATGGTDGYVGVNVLDATGGRLAKWGPGSGGDELDFSDNLFAGIGSGVVLHERASAGTWNDEVQVTWRMSVPVAKPAGAYSTDALVTVIAQP